MQDLSGLIIVLLSLCGFKVNGMIGLNHLQENTPRSQRKPVVRILHLPKVSTILSQIGLLNKIDLSEHAVNLVRE